MGFYEETLAEINTKTHTPTQITLIISDLDGNTVIESWFIPRAMYDHIRTHYDLPDARTVINVEGKKEVTEPSEVESADPGVSSLPE